MDRDGVLGVRCQGEMGVRRLGLEAPGRERPACSRCSGTKDLSYGFCWGEVLKREEGGELTVRPA